MSSTDEIQPAQAQPELDVESLLKSIATDAISTLKADAQHWSDAELCALLNALDPSVGDHRKSRFRISESRGVGVMMSLGG